MGYLDNRTITVEAILTKKGRQLLSQGKQFFNITKFALADDEVDYHLWNPAHPSGSNYYGYAIEQMPVLEPTPDETQTMRYKLVSLNKTTVKIPVVSVNPTSVTFTQGQEVIISPSTVFSGGNAEISLNSSLGYTAILHNSDVAYLQVATAAPSVPPADDKSPEIFNVGTGTFLGDSEAAKSVFAVGLTFRLIAKQITSTANLQTTVTVIGNETGGSAILTVTNKRIRLEER